uniref:Cytochrome c assembly protein domain-containing protein n=1 Tax=Chenopodium quinoa TaxID=63459 RepID=A0A803MRN5_CHEQI
MDINEPSLMDVAHDTINSTQGPSLIEVAYSPSSEGKGQGRAALAWRIASPRNDIALYRSRSVFATAGKAVVEAKPIAPPTIKYEIGPLLQNWMEWPTPPKSAYVIWELMAGNNPYGFDIRCYGLNAELLTLLVWMGVHPKVFPDRMHTSSSRIQAQSSQYVPMPSVGKSLRPALGDLEVPEAKNYSLIVRRQGYALGSEAHLFRVQRRRGVLTRPPNPAESNPVPQDLISAIHPPCIYAGDVASAMGFGLCRSKMMNGIVALHSPPMRKDVAEKNGTLLCSAGCVGSRITSELFTLKFKHVGAKCYPALLLRSKRSLLMLLRRRFFAFSSLWTRALVDTGRERAKRFFRNGKTKTTTLPLCWTADANTVVSDQDQEPIRIWILTCRCFLTVGILPGSWWAHHELGRGGWWFRDPVENASFMPRVLATARTFSIRSGLLAPVHSFATDDTRGIFLWRFFLLMTGISMILFSQMKQQASALPYHLAQASLSDWLNTENRVSSWGFSRMGYYTVASAVALEWRTNQSRNRNPTSCELTSGEMGYLSIKAIPLAWRLATKLCGSSAIDCISEGNIASKGAYPANRGSWEALLKWIRPYLGYEPILAKS